MATCENTYAVLVQDEPVLLVKSLSSVNAQSDCDLFPHMLSSLYSEIRYATCMQHVCKAMCFYDTRLRGGEGVFGGPVHGVLVGGVVGGLDVQHVHQHHRLQNSNFRVST